MSHPDAPGPDAPGPDAPGPGGQAPGSRRLTPEGATAMFRSALRQVLLFLGALAVLAVVVAPIFAGVEGLWGALLGVAVAVLFSATTVWSMWRSSHTDMAAMLGIIAGTWLGKMVVLFAALIALKPLTFYSKPVFVIVLLIGVFGSMVIDVQSVRRARIPYVDPQ